MGLPTPINWVSRSIGSADFLLYSSLCKAVSEFEDCVTVDEFFQKIEGWIVNFETEYRNVIEDEFVVPKLKLRIYQQIISQLPLPIGNQTYTVDDFNDLEFISTKIYTTQDMTSLMKDEVFINCLWNALSIGLKICNYQDNTIAAMRDTMSIKWLLAQKDTDTFKNKDALMKLIDVPAGKHGFAGLGSLFG